MEEAGPRLGSSPLPEGPDDLPGGSHFEHENSTGRQAPRAVCDKRVFLFAALRGDLSYERKLRRASSQPQLEAGPHRPLAARYGLLQAADAAVHLEELSPGTRNLRGYESHCGRALGRAYLHRGAHRADGARPGAALQEERTR